MVKNVFFISVLGVIGAGSSVLNEASAEIQTQRMNWTVPATQQVKLVPDAVIAPERLSRSANMSYQVKGVRYVPRRTLGAFSQNGTASWYGNQFNGRKTSSGERYNMNEMTAAHKTLPIPSYARVTNTANGKSVIVRINDRGPFHSNRVMDLSYAAAKKLGYASRGTAQVRIEQILPQNAAAQTSTPYTTLKTFAHLDDAEKYMKASTRSALSINHGASGYEVREAIAADSAAPTQLTRL